MATKRTSPSYPPIIERLVPTLLTVLAVIMVIMLITSALVVLGVFR